MTVAVINGASQGIDAGVAAGYRSAGYAVVGTSRSIEHADQRAIGQMVTQRSGHIVNITTRLVDHANAREPSALASLTKGGLAAVTRSPATEYASRGVRVNAVAPGVVRTDRRSGSYEGAAELHPLGRMTEISDVVDGILYLERASFVTGETLHIDGGQGGRALAAVTQMITNYQHSVRSD